VSPRRAGRVVRRLLGLGAELAWSAAQVAIGGRNGPRAVHLLSRRLLRLLGVRLRVAGEAPGAGLVVSNHLGYLDILVFASLAPTVFVAKSEVRSWPVFGWFARRSGTVFVERGRARSVAAAAQAIDAALTAGARVVLFPEGTSSGGAAVLPFKSPLLEPARRSAVTAAAVAYLLPPGDGDTAEEVCYWKDMSLGPHLVRLLGKRRIDAAVVLSAPCAAPMDRKELARRLRTEVVALKSRADQALPGLTPAAAGRRRPRRGRSPTAWIGSAPRG
jgi:1-acyl-sn-glycerol-3-phosphate acyltransferase